MKSIIIYLRSAHDLSVAYHNLDQRKAQRLLARLHEEQQDAYLVDQPEKHRGKAENCELCRNAGIDFLREAMPYSPLKAAYVKKVAPPEEPISLGETLFAARMEFEERPKFVWADVLVLLRKALPVLVGLILIGIVVWLSTGPLAPALSQTIQSLQAAQPSTTNTLTATPPPTNTPEATVTLAAVIPTQRPPATSTSTAAPPTATAEPACWDASEVTISNTGEMLCVQGTVLKAYYQEPAFYIIFSHDYESFYMVSYDQRFDDLMPGDCVFATGEIKQLQMDPIMVLGIRDTLERCP